MTQEVMLGYTPVLLDCNNRNYIPVNVFFATKEEAQAYGKWLEADANRAPVDTNGDQLEDIAFMGTNQVTDAPNAKFAKGRLTQVKAGRTVGLRAKVTELLGRIQDKARETVGA